MNLELANKIVLVSGGAKGIGAAIVRELFQEGAVPVIVGRNEQENKALLAEISKTPLDAFQVAADLVEPAACQLAVHQVIQRFGRIDGLVNNAGVNDGVGLENGSYESFMSSLHKNLVHYYLLAHHSLPALIAQKGAIVNIGSKTAETGQGETSAYAAANGGRNSLTREWAVELLKYGIRVNSVIVSECWTPSYQSWIAKDNRGQEKLNKVLSTIPLGMRMTKPEEIAKMVVFLLSKASSHTTGQLIHVDGGYVHLDRALLGTL